MKSIISAVQELIKHNVNDPSVGRASDVLVAKLASAEGEHLVEQVRQLKIAAQAPAYNYAKILKIAQQLEAAAEGVAEEDDEVKKAEGQAAVASLVAKVAGIFALVDTADEISKHSLEQIEAAVHKLYKNGKMNSPNTYKSFPKGS